MGFTMHDVERGQFLEAMRGVANSVSVVATDGVAGRHGATVSAFCSVSADPPTVLVCLHGQSRIARMVSDNGIFAVNVLPEGAEDIASRFAGAHDAQITDRFDGIELEIASAPGITGATVFQCEVAQEVPSASHQVFIGRVTAIYGGGAAPLIYHSGQFSRLNSAQPERMT